MVVRLDAELAVSSARRMTEQLGQLVINGLALTLNTRGREETGRRIVREVKGGHEVSVEYTDGTALTFRLVGTTIHIEFTTGYTIDWEKRVVHLGPEPGAA